MPRRAFISLILKVSGNVNADMGIGTRIPLKKIITWDQQIKPFVSARCIRRGIRVRLHERDLPISPLQLVGSGERAQLGDVGDPVLYVDDDLFGFLRPEEPPIRRSAPIKISHLISLRHAEVKVEFAGRFPREFLPNYVKDYPVPFEIELAEWLGKLNVIISDRIGRFTEDELTQEARGRLQSGQLALPDEERRRRLMSFAEILLWEGWEFPRGAQSPSIPEFHHAVVALSERFIPLFGLIDIGDDGNLSPEGVEQIRALYGGLIDRLHIVNYRRSKYSSYERRDGKLQPIAEAELGAEGMRNIINTLCDYIVG